MLLLDGQVHHDTHVIPLGNYVIGVGNYVGVSPSDLGNYVSADSQQRIGSLKSVPYHDAAGGLAFEGRPYAECADTRGC